ncbi:hypothetical protein F5B20DRAFT_524042 [Whalleya microplaca]|nr:hypothetical protein F5B20DRAFT_524042 [Whalleya microplaca]
MRAVGKRLVLIHQPIELLHQLLDSIGYVHTSSFFARCGHLVVLAVPAEILLCVLEQFGVIRWLLPRLWLIVMIVCCWSVAAGVASLWCVRLCLRNPQRLFRLWWPRALWYGKRIPD